MAEETLLPNDPEKILDADILGIIGEYAELDRDSKKLSEKRTRLRTKALKNHGIESHDLQEAVYRLKKQAKADRTKGIKVVNRIISAVDGRQGEFWAEEVAAQDKRKSRKAEKDARAKAAAAKAKAESIEAGDDSPRSDPARGGAGKAKGRGKAKTPGEVISGAAAASDGALKDAIEAAESTSDQRAKITALEQEAGDKVLTEMAPQTLGDEKPLSQSEIARQKLEEAKLA